MLTGDTTDLTKVPNDCVVGILISELVPGAVALDRIPSLEDLYRRVAAGVGTVDWGTVAMTVPADNRPTIKPIQVAFELRAAVDAAVVQAGLSASRRHVPCALALCFGLKQVQQTIDMGIALTLAFEVVFGAAKMMPMSRRALASAAFTAQFKPGG